MSTGGRDPQGFTEGQWLRISLLVPGTQVRSLIRAGPVLRSNEAPALTTEPVLLSSFRWALQALGGACAVEPVRHR